MLNSYNAVALFRWWCGRDGHMLSLLCGEWPAELSFWTVVRAVALNAKFLIHALAAGPFFRGWQQRSAIVDQPAQIQCTAVVSLNAGTAPGLWCLQTDTPPHVNSALWTSHAWWQVSITHALTDPPS